MEAGGKLTVAGAGLAASAQLRCWNQCRAVGAPHRGWRRSLSEAVREVIMGIVTEAPLDSRMHMGRMLRDIQLAEADLSPFSGCLWLGRWIDACKGTAMGLARYEVLRC